MLQDVYHINLHVLISHHVTIKSLYLEKAIFFSFHHLYLNSYVVSLASGQGQELRQAGNQDSILTLLTC